MPEMNRKTAASAMPASAPWGNTFDLFAIVKQIVGAKAQFGSLADAWADTATSTGRLMIAVFGGAALPLPSNAVIPCAAVPPHGCRADRVVRASAARAVADRRAG